jgi:glutamate synthase (NADPH/NADH) large chain
MVELEPIPDEEEISARVYHHSQDLEAHGRVDVMEDMTQFDAQRLYRLISNHVRYTGSERGAEIIADWKNYCRKFRKVMPIEYRRALAEMAKAGALQAAE